MSALRRVQLGGKTVLDERFVESAERRQAPALDEVILRGAQAGPFETETRISVVGGEAQRLRVFRNRPVVVLTLLGVAAAAKAPPRWRRR